MNQSAVKRCLESNSDDGTRDYEKAVQKHTDKLSVDNDSDIITPSLKRESQ